MGGIADMATIMLMGRLVTGFTGTGTNTPMVVSRIILSEADLLTKVIRNAEFREMNYTYSLIQQLYQTLTTRSTNI